MSERNYNDPELIGGIKNGNARIINDFYAMHYSDALKYVRSKGGGPEDAKDVMQEAMYGLLLSLGRPDFQLRKTLGGYFSQICRNKWKERLTKMKLDDEVREQMLIETPDIIGVDDDPGEELRLLVFRNMRLLNQECRQVIDLYFKKMPFKAIAERMNLNSEDTARRRKKDCLDKLKAHVKRDVDLNAEQ